MSYDLAAIYRESFERLTDLAPTLTEEQLATIVPACPAWSVKDCIAHVAGIAADIAEGNLAPATDEATARQVEQRRGATITEVVEEWRRHLPAMEALLSANPKAGAPVIDVWTHEQDIRGALGMPGLRSGPGLALTLRAGAAIKGKVLGAGLAGLRVVVGDDDRVIGPEPAGATVRAEPYEWARTVMGRRSLAQMAALDWDGDPTPYLPLLPVFPPPDQDLVD